MTSTARSIESLTTARASLDRVLEAAKALGLTVPLPLLALADEVIE